MVSPPAGLLSNFFLLTPGFTRGHNCVAQFGPFGCYNSNGDKNGIEEVFTTYYNSWLDNQIRRIFTIMTPGATGGYRLGKCHKSPAGGEISIIE